MASKSVQGFETLKESLKRKQNKAVDRKTICNVKLTRTKTGLKNVPWGFEQCYHFDTAVTKSKFNTVFK